MQDSSTNPYIPEQDDRTRAATETLSSPLKRTVKLLMIITLVLAILIGAGLFFVIPRTSAEDKVARTELANAIQPPGQLAKLVPVKSTLGFSLKYDNLLFASYAETMPPVDKSGKAGASAYYENDDLRTVRDYKMVRLTPVESTDSDRSAVADPPQLVVSSPMSLAELKKNESKPDYKGLSDAALFVQVSRDARLAAKTADDGTTMSINATKASSETINGVKYQWVRYTIKNENYRIVNEKYDDCYYTIQNDTPVSACITNVRPNSRDAAALNEQMLQSLAFHKPKVNSEAAKKDENTVTSAPLEKEERLPLETPTSVYNSDFVSLATIAKNQPASVRVGTLYCADLNLKLASGDIATTLTDACVGGLSSGTIVSKDGLIATTGHAIRYSPKAAINGYINFADNQKDLLDRLDRVLDYLLKARLILESDADYLKTGAQVGEQEALAKIENIGSIIPDNYITPTKDAYTYSVQPTDKPLVLDTNTGSRPVFAYSDTVLEAKFVAADYDVSKSKQDTFDNTVPSKDVGLLKVEGTYQNAGIGRTSIKTNDTLSIIGFPAFSDRSLVIGRNQNSPIVTVTKANQVYEKEGRQLVQANVAIKPGNDGGGVFDQTGKLVGQSVYGLSYCPDQRCFSQGTIRPSSELLALLESKNMKTPEVSDASEVWATGIEEYFKGNYAAASGSFAKAGNMSSFNTLATPLRNLAESKKGSSSDTSFMNQLVGIMIAALVCMIILTIAFAVVFFLQKRRLDALHVGHYGEQAGSSPVVASPQAAAIPGVAAPQPVQPYSYSQQQYASTQPVVMPTQSQQPQPQPQQAPQPPATPTSFSAPQYPATPQQPTQPAAYPSPQPQQPPVSPQAPVSGPVEDPFYRQ